MSLGMSEGNFKSVFGTSEKGTNFLQIVATEEFFLLRPIHSIGRRIFLRQSDSYCPELSNDFIYLIYA